MSRITEISVAAVNAGELNQEKPRWMPLEGNPEVIRLDCLSDLLLYLYLGIKRIHKRFGC